MTMTRHDRQTMTQNQRARIATRQNWTPQRQKRQIADSRQNASIMLIAAPWLRLAVPLPPTTTTFIPAACRPWLEMVALLRPEQSRRRPTAAHESPHAPIIIIALLNCRCAIDACPAVKQSWPSDWRPRSRLPKPPGRSACNAKIRFDLPCQKRPCFRPSRPRVLDAAQKIKMARPEYEAAGLTGGQGDTLQDRHAPAAAERQPAGPTSRAWCGGEKQKVSVGRGPPPLSRKMSCPSS